jgi:hypothetical protein
MPDFEIAVPAAKLADGLQITDYQLADGPGPWRVMGHSFVGAAHDWASMQQEYSSKASRELV